MFNNGHKLLENEPYSGQPATLWNEDNVRQVEEVMQSYHQLVESTAEELLVIATPSSVRFSCLPIHHTKNANAGIL
jgi:hypothetical protein